MRIRFGLVGLCFFGVFASISWAQNTPQLQPNVRPAKPDSLRGKPAKKQLKEPIKFSGDSLRLVFDPKNGDIGRLKGNSKIEYDQVKVESSLMQFYFKTNLVEARSAPKDTSQAGRPRFSRENETFSAKELTFNLKTKQGRLLAGKTKMQDGFVLSSIAKTRGDSILYVQNGYYTTCTDENHPHYMLRAKRMKIINNRWIFSGPIQLKLLNIPIPIVVPFGAIPAIEGRRSGPIQVAYGQDRDQGFYLKNWGWYWAINDYMDATVRFGVWTKGSFQVNPTLRYAKRYRYDGSVDFAYRYVVTGERYDPDRNPRSNWDFSLRHAQKVNPTTNLSANIRLTNSRLLRSVSDDYDTRLSTSSAQTSNFSYDKRWSHKGRSVSVYGTLSDNVSTRAANLTFPSFRFSQRSQTPFRQDGASGALRPKVYESLQYDAGFDFSTEYAFQPTASDVSEYRWWDGLRSADVYRSVTGLEASQRLYVRGTGNFSAQMPYTLRKTPIMKKDIQLNIGPSFSLREYLISREEGRMRVYRNSTYKDSTFYAPALVLFHDMSFSMNASTTVYGTFPWKVGRFNGFRHVMTPSLSFSTRPDYTTDFWGYFKTLTDTQGKEITDQNGDKVRYAVYSGVPTGQSRSLNFSMGNVFRTRTIQTDSTGTVRKQVFDLLNLNVSSGYNFAADSMRLQPIRFSGYTNVANRLSLNLSGGYGPYSNFYGGLRDFSFSMSTSLRAKEKRMARRQGTEAAPVARTDPDFATFEMPWTLSLDASYSYSAPYTTTSKATQSAIINTRFTTQLTPQWRIEGRTGYDFIRGTFSSSEISVHRDLHCWEMSFRAVPFGRYQSFQFSLNVKSGKLKSILRISQPKSDIRGALNVF